MALFEVSHSVSDLYKGCPTFLASGILVLTFLLVWDIIYILGMANGFNTFLYDRRNIFVNY